MRVELPFCEPRSDERMHLAIDAIKAELGGELVLLGHHYQSDEIVRHVDLVGDSLELSRMVTQIDASNIVFCGVHFMAESACLLARPGQRVFLPDPGAACVMADMVPAALLEKIILKILATGRKIVPLAYVNTSLAVKAVVGKYKGAVCTSANAETMLAWALEQGDGVLFLPDKNLGNNAADQLGLPENSRYVLDIRQNGDKLDPAALRKASLLLWPGCCAVHNAFTPELAAQIRQERPQARILVHPECTPAMVRAADSAGSTSYLIRETENAPDGACLAIGTEINLVRRLSEKHGQRLEVMPLTGSYCSNMAKITVPVLLDLLRGIRDGGARPVLADRQLLEPARASLVRMLDHC